MLNPALNIECTLNIILYLCSVIMTAFLFIFPGEKRLAPGTAHTVAKQCTERCMRGTDASSSNLESGLREGT